MAQGDLKAALKSYSDSLAIFERLAKSDPGNADWQRDLSVSYNKVGDVQMAQGDLKAALKSYSDSRAIFERLAQIRPRQCRLAARSLGELCETRRHLPEVQRYGASSRSFDDWPSNHRETRGSTSRLGGLETGFGVVRWTIRGIGKGCAAGEARTKFGKKQEKAAVGERPTQFQIGASERLKWSPENIPQEREQNPRTPQGGLFFNYHYTPPPRTKRGIAKVILSSTFDHDERG